MIQLGALSVKDPETALKCLRLESIRRDMDVAKSCYWVQSDGGLITLGEMSDDHLKNTISMLERAMEHNAIIAEGGAE